MSKIEEQIPEFNPDRLRQALRARAYKQSELARRLDISRALVNQVLTGTKKPPVGFFHQVCEVLELPPEFFFQNSGPALTKDAAIFFRRYSTTCEASIQASEQKLEWLVELLEEILKYVAIPPANIPRSYSNFNVNVDRTEEIEGLALECRRLWGLGDGPILDLVRFMELNGVLISRANLGFDKIDAFSCWVNDAYPVVLLGSDKSCCVRSRFDASHELGHLILHQGVPNRAILDKPSYKKLESEADRFASAFLMPSTSFPQEIYFDSLEHFVQLKKRWLVSVAAMVRRCRDTGRISQNRYETLYQQISKNRWRKNEPLDNEIPYEEPALISKAVEMAIESGSLTPQGLQNVLKIKLSEIEELLSLRPGFLLEKMTTAKVIPIHLKNKG